MRGLFLRRGFFPQCSARLSRGSPVLSALGGSARCSSSVASNTKALLAQSWRALRNRQIEKCLPKFVFSEEPPAHVFLGLKILEDRSLPEEVVEESNRIEESLQEEARGCWPFAASPEEVRAIDLSLLDTISAACAEASAVGRYLFEAPGKRLRPLLLLFVRRALRLLDSCGTSRISLPRPLQHRANQAFFLLPTPPTEAPKAPRCAFRTEAPQTQGGENEDTSLDLVMISVAELIHTASLLHDDVLDEADLRRGRPSAQSVFGNKRAILGGDFILARASAIAATAGFPEVCLRVASTVESLVKGEILQTITSGTDIEACLKALLCKSYHKTAALMAETCACVAIIGRRRREWVDWAHAFGSCVGLALQLADDELDLLASAEESGKTANLDLKTGVVTAPLLLAAQEHPEELLPLLARRLRGPRDASLALEKIRASAALPRSRLLIRLYAQHALRLIQRLPLQSEAQARARSELAALTLAVVTRASLK